MQVALIADMPGGDARRDDYLISEVADTLVELMTQGPTRWILLSQPQVMLSSSAAIRHPHSNPIATSHCVASTGDASQTQRG